MSYQSNAALVMGEEYFSYDVPEILALEKRVEQFSPVMGDMTIEEVGRGRGIRRDITPNKIDLSLITYGNEKMGRTAPFRIFLENLSKGDFPPLDIQELLTTGYPNFPHFGLVLPHGYGGLPVVGDLYSRAAKGRIEDVSVPVMLENLKIHSRNPFQEGIFQNQYL